MFMEKSIMKSFARISSKFLHSKGNTQQTEEETNKIGENVCKLYIQ